MAEIVNTNTRPSADVNPDTVITSVMNNMVLYTLLALGAWFVLGRTK